MAIRGVGVHADAMVDQWARGCGDVSPDELSERFDLGRSCSAIKGVRVSRVATSVQCDFETGAAQWGVAGVAGGEHRRSIVDAAVSLADCPRRNDGCEE